MINRIKSGKLFLCVVFVFTLLFSCKKDSSVPGSPSFSYFPTDKGKYVVYDVDSVYHAENDGNTDDSIYTWHYQVKEVLDSTYLDVQGRFTQIVKRYRRDSDTLEWSEINSWTQVLTSFSAYRTEENVPYHKLSFPISDHITWNGNDANTDDPEMYVYEDFHIAGTVNGVSFDSTLSVLQRNDDNAVERIFGKEVYANHVGMIYKERDNLNKIPGIGVVKGTEFRMKVNSYGRE